jgi:GntR family transcriptional regulator, sialic acid-inducible nan operon repressor
MVEPIQIERRKLFEHVAEHLEGLILSGKLKPGDRLPPERELQSAFGVGRPAIREALITLERAGLVEIGNGAPARVARPTAAGLLSAMVPGVRHMLSTTEGNRSFQAIRLLVEVGLVRQAAKDATADLISDLHRALDDNWANVDNAPSFIESDVHFHYVIGAFSGDPAILAIHAAVNDWLLEQRKVAGREPGERERACEAHSRIMAAIEARDPDAAEAAMRAHLQSGWASYWKHIADA